jgi:hypothetical protein
MYVSVCDYVCVRVCVCMLACAREFYGYRLGRRSHGRASWPDPSQPEALLRDHI